MRTLAAAACLVVAALAVAGVAPAQRPERPLPTLAAGADDALFRALAEGRLSEAQYALERARSLFQLARVRRELFHSIGSCSFFEPVEELEALRMLSR